MLSLQQAIEIKESIVSYLKATFTFRKNISNNWFRRGSTALLADYVEKIFGETITEEAIVGENRVNMDAYLYTIEKTKPCFFGGYTIPNIINFISLA